MGYGTVAQKGQTQISLPKHKTVSQNTNQFTKTQINFPKHKSVYQNTKQFLKTQINFPKRKSVYQNTNQFHKTQTNFAKHKSKDWALALSLSESLGGTHSQGFPRPTWRLLKALAQEDTLLRTHCCRHKCFPVCPRAQHLLRTQILCPGHKKCF